MAPNLFVQDRTGGVWVDLRGFHGTPPQPGQLVDMRGVAGLGFSPYIAQPTWTILGSAPPPKPLPLTYEQAATGAFDSQWVEMEGVVRSFVQQAEGNVLVIDAAGPIGSFKVRVPNYLAHFPMYLVDAKVRFRGVCASDFNRRNQLVGMHLMMPSLQDLKILKPAPPDGFSIPVSPVDSIRRFSADLPDVHRVKVVGTVTARYPGIGLFLMDATGGVYVETQDGAPVGTGDRVEAIGFPAPGDYSPVLRSGSIHSLHAHIVLTPAKVTGRVALKGGFDAQLVNISGTVHSEHERMGDLVLDMESADRVTFEAVLQKTPEAALPVPVGSFVSLTGICAVRADENGNPADFQIVLRTPADIALISSPSWLTARHAAFLVAGLVTITFAIIGWVVILRRRVRQQTLLIQRRLEAEAALEKRYRRVFERNTAGLFIAEPGGHLIDCNEACASILGFRNREHLLAHIGNAEETILQFCTSPEADDTAAHAEYSFQRFDGKWAWVLCNARWVENGGGRSVIEGTLVDVSDRKMADERIQFLAYYDSLTGLPNRTLLQDRLSKALAAARRHNEEVAVLFLDLDRFKYINDSLGHSVGDELLKKVARCLEDCARDQDTVARLGGDEFLVVLSAVEESSDAAIVAERICSEIGNGFEVQGQMLNVTCSVGISIFPEHGYDAETLIKNADAAMYSSKDAGRNTFRFFTEKMTAQAVERLTLESSLRTALEKDQLFVVYQPEIDLTTGQMICCEALLRWDHPTLGLVPPGRFIEVAESAGMIIRIGEWVLRTACAQARKWQQDGIMSTPVAVNVSAVQFRQDGFCEMVRRVLTETGLPAQFLELELTESVLLAHEDLTFQVLGELKALGVSLALDDFGTGYSSLSYLKQFPVNKLKIDRAFIKEIATNSRDASIAAAIINMARCLDMKVTAEGVEDEAQLALLRALGCDQVQGFFLSKPLFALQLQARAQRNLGWTSVLERAQEFGRHSGWVQSHLPLSFEYHPASVGENKPSS